MSSGVDDGPRNPGRDSELQVEAAGMRRVGIKQLLDRKALQQGRVEPSSYGDRFASCRSSPLGCWGDCSVWKRLEWRLWEGKGRDYVTTKEHDFGLGAPVSEAEKYQNKLQLEQEIEDLKQTNHGLEEYVRKLLDSKELGTNCDVELLKTTRDREELKCMLEKYERHLAEIQGNVKVLTSERDKTFLLYEQAQEEIARLRREMMKNCKSPKSTTAHAILRRVETERDVAFTDLRRMTTERDSLRERLKIAQETAFNEKAHLEQRIEELECTVHNLDDERMEQMSNMTLMKETITTVEKEMKSLARKAMDTESELGRQKAENNSLSTGGQEVGHMKMELFVDVVPKTAKNFRQFFTGEFRKGGVLIRYKGSTFHRVIKDFMIQGGDFVNGDGTGVARIYRGPFADENFKLRHSVPGLLSMANSGPSTNGCQFFITCSKCDWLDGKHVVFGKIIDGLIVMRKIENVPTGFNNKPKLPVVISQCGEALSKKLNDTHNELNDIKQKVQDTNLEVNKLKNILKSEESENRQMMDQLRKANEDAENWENKARQAEADNNTLKLELITAEAEGNRLKEKVDSLNREVEQMENELDSARSEIELLRSQMTNERISMQNLEALLVANRDKEYQSQIALQEKDSEIQLLKEHLCLAENKMAIQSRDVAQFRNVVTQLEADLDITKRQLGTERFEREKSSDPPS
ncbi:hypothetical protein GH733_009372 [Mirounga leonina]|nr:hypothetical protein GH733_009372 [Mirounga leonina]